jgi:ATP-dependent RNA helicase DHX36
MCTCAQLPLEPAIGRMLLMGCAFECVAPTVVAAACYGARSPFLLIAARRQETMEHKFRMWAEDDIATSVAAYRQWEAIKRAEGRQAASDWAFQRNLMLNSLTSIEQNKKQLIKDLAKMGFFTEQQYYHSEEGAPGPNRRAGNEALAAALRFAGICTNVAKRLRVRD